MENQCRTCLTLSSNFKYYSLLTIFPEFARKSLSVLDLLGRVTLTKVELSDDLPSKICSECFKSLKLVYSFIVTFRHSQMILLQNHTGQTQQDQNKNKELVLDWPQEQIIIITEEENAYTTQAQTDNILSNTNKIEQSKSLGVNVEEEYAEDETISDPKDYLHEEVNMSEHNDGIELAEISLEEEIDMSEDNNPLELVEISSIQSEDILNQEADLEIANMEETIGMQKIPKNTETKRENKGDNKPRQIFTCDKCDKVFYSKGSLAKHNYNFHHPEWTKIYRCSLCNEVFHSKNTLGYHKLSKHSGKSFSCNTCDKKFITPSILKKHIEGVHKKTRPKRYLCSICGRGFTYNTALKYHMGKVHTHKRDFVCDYCGAAFILKGQLTYHERSHTGELPFRCKYCNKGYKRSPEKRVHEQTHLGIYPHKCEYCKAKVFTSSYNKKVHLLQHFGDYECEVCSTGFATADILKFHYMHKHKIKDVVIQENGNYV